MSVSIGRVVTEVVPAPEPGADAGAAARPGTDLARLRRELARAERAALRTRAEGFED